MSSYLDKLKQLDDEKFYRHTPDIELTKPPKAPYVSFGSTSTGHIEKIFTESESSTPHEPDCIDTLASDCAELDTLIGELCRIVGYSGEVQGRILAARRNLYPFRVADERDYFRLQVERAKAGKYWTTKPQTNNAIGNNPAMATLDEINGR